MPTPPPSEPAVKGERIAKVIARAGVCSRRDAERLIGEGKVTLDGRRLTSPAVNVTADSVIKVNGKPLPAAEKTRLWRYHKPRGVLTAARDPEGRPTIYDQLPKDLPRVQPVGRLDMNSEGLLLLTNDGELKRRLELPATAWIRRYRVRVHGSIDPAALERLAQGTTIEGIRYGPIEARLERRTGANAWLLMALKEGKNREVRRVCENLGLTVNRLIRISYGPFQLGQMKPRDVIELPAKVLADQLDLESAKKSTAGFAKAKPRPKRPGGRKPGANKTGTKKPSHADRRRKA